MFLLGSGRRLFGRIAHAVELREDQVPDFDLAEGRVVVDFAARAADAVGPLAGGVGRPEVLVLAQPLQPLGRQLDLVEPDAGRLVVVEIDRGRELFRRRRPSHFLLGQELPGPVDRLALEIVAEAEVAQHLEERVVVGGAADVVDVAGAQAFLAGRGPGELQLAAAEEVVLELVHAGRREQHRGVPAGHQHVAGPADAALGLEEGQVFFAEFVGFHAFGPPTCGGETGKGIESLIISADGGPEKPGQGGDHALATCGQSPPAVQNDSAQPRAAVPRSSADASIFQVVGGDYRRRGRLGPPTSCQVRGR